MLAAEAIERAALALEGVHDVHGDDGLAAGVLGVRDRVADDGLEEDFEDVASLFVDETGNTFHASATSQATDGRLGNALDIIAKDLPVALGASLSKAYGGRRAQRAKWATRLLEKSRKKKVNDGEDGRACGKICDLPFPPLPRPDMVVDRT